MYSFTGIRRFPAVYLLQLPYVDTTKQKARIDAANQLPQDVAFVSFPALDKSSALNLAVASHELGHLVDYVLGIYKKILPLTLDQPTFDSAVQQEVQLKTPTGAKPDPKMVQQVENRYFQTCNKMLESWLMEIIADVLAIRALGPAYLFSFMEFFAVVAAENTHDTEHPAPAKRLLMLFSELKDMHYFDVKTGILGHLTAVRSNVQSEAGVTSYTREALVVNATVESNMSGILVPIRNIIGSHSFTAEEYDKEVPPLVDKLIAGIAPIEIPGTGGSIIGASSVAILNAGWHVKKTHSAKFLDLFKTNVPVPQRWQTLDQLILKAIESAYVVGTFKGTW